MKSPTEEEIITGIARMDNRKASGPDKIQGELIRYGGEARERVVIELFHNIWRAGEVPRELS